MPVSVPESAVPTGPKGSITVASAIASGVGGMMGAGLAKRMLALGVPIVVVGVMIAPSR